MCRILLNKENKAFDKQELEQSYMQNPDGTGLYYFDYDINKAVITKWAKGTPFEDIWKVVDSLKNKNAKNVNIHFRLGTSGGIGTEQTHPIEMSNGIYMMHNGICHDFVWNTEKFSDTQCMAYWVDQILQQHHIKDISELATDEFLVAYLANKFNGSKVVLMQQDKILILNEKLGEWKDGIWKSWKEYTYVNYYDNWNYYGDDYQITWIDKKNIPHTQTFYYCKSINDARKKLYQQNKDQVKSIEKVKMVNEDHWI